jgi:hypothetical protein
MTNKTLAIALGAALLLPTLAFAEVQVVNGEAGMIFKDAPSTITREQVRAELKSGTAIGDQHFKFVGGEAGWIHEGPTHRMVVQNGNLVHAADCPVMASMNTPKAKGSNEPLPGYYAGA